MTRPAPLPRRVGFAAYLWNLADQDRLLVETLVPTVTELRAEGLVDRFHFDRFDTRGRHLYGFVTTAEGRQAAVGERLEIALRQHLPDGPGASPVSLEERQRAHDDCRGAVMCPADEQPGLAEEGTFLVYPQEADAAALRHARHPDADDTAQLVDLINELDGWLLDLIAAVPHTRREGHGVLWAAAVDHALRRRGADAAGYWRYHASTLLLGLEERLAADPDGVTARLVALLSDANRRTFEALWRRALEPGIAWCGVDRLVALACRDRRDGEPSWGLLRDLDHTVLRQLGIPVRLQLSFILYAWLRPDR